MKFTEGQTVKIRAIGGHRCDGMTGTVLIPKTLIGTVSVDIEGQTYGFFAAELVPLDTES